MKAHDARAMAIEAAARGMLKPEELWEIACRWMVNVSRAYGRTGRLVEKYDVIAPDRAGTGGEYPLQDGFGWTNGVMTALMTLYPSESAYSDVASCPIAGPGALQ